MILCALSQCVHNTLICISSTYTVHANRQLAPITKPKEEKNMWLNLLRKGLTIGRICTSQIHNFLTKLFVARVNWTHSLRFSLDPGKDWGLTWARVMYSFLSRFPTRTRIFDSTRPILREKTSACIQRGTGNTSCIEFLFLSLFFDTHHSKWFSSVDALAVRTM